MSIFYLITGIIAFFVQSILIKAHGQPGTTIPFSSLRWQYKDNYENVKRLKEYKLETYLGKESVHLINLYALLQDADFRNGIIEYDTAFPPDRGGIGLFCRMQDVNNCEWFYIRPHQSGNPDATQYIPLFHSNDSWQLYHGSGYNGTEDLPRFYQAFDSVLTTKDSLRQIEIIQTLYVDKASAGLKEFMKLRGGNAVEWEKFMLKEKQSIIEKRPWILSALTQQGIIKKKLRRFKKLYPDFRDGDVYFCVGINNSGGTIYDKTVYIGTEVVASKSDNWAVFMVLHEFAHTQQWTQRNIIRLKNSDTLGYEYMRTHTLLPWKCLEEGMEIN